ncbi:MAG TPA: efflux RND transporter permease subunit [Verrucomicrobiae bacterium]|nr:efflux RND transporter permease subunit [Verrucomicrobiae bacterium]
MQKLAEICIRRPVFASMLILTLVVVGSASFVHLAVDRFPAVDLPTVRINTRLPGASPAEVESQISKPIEESVNTVEGIKELQSISGSGMSFINVNFELNRDIEAAAQDVRDRVAAVLRELPRDADPPIITKSDNNLSPVLSIAITGQRSHRELTELADKVVKVQVERSFGVGEVEIIGGLERAINIWVDADRLAAYQIPITAVRAAVERQNADVAGGNVTTSLREQSLRTMGRLPDARAFNDLTIVTRKGTPIRVRDIGRAEDGTKEPRSAARLNGVPSVTMDVLRQSAANTVAVIEGVKAKLHSIQSQLPADVRLEIIRDQSRYIYEALHEIQRHLILGSILACLVVLLFMRNWRATVIAAVAIPTSVIATFAMMKALDFTLNSVTMLALVLMVGIVIDDAIVVLENIFRYIEEKKMAPFEAARAATAEIGLPVMATTFSLVVIFVPVSFMSSISGRFLYQFGITAAVAVLVSLLVSFTLTPMMSARLLRPANGAGAHLPEPRSRRGFYAVLDRTYTGLLTRAMQYRWWLALASLLVIASSVPLYKLVRQEYVPSNTDEGEFDVYVNAPEGASLDAMKEVANRVETEIRAVRGVRLVLTSIGSGGFLGGVNGARFYVRLAPHAERIFSWQRLLHWPPWRAFQGNYSQRDAIMEIRRRLKQFPDLRGSVRNPQTFSLGGPNYDIDFALLGPELKDLAAYGEQLRQRAPQLGLLDADTTLRLDKPELQIEIDRERAARLGVDTEDIATAVRIMVGGDQKVSRFRDESVNDDYDVQLRLQESDRNDAAAIARLYVPRQGGGLIRLDNVVKIVPAQSASRIDRLDRQRLVRLRAAVAPGYAQADRIAALRAEVASMNLGPEYSTRVSGRARELETTFQEFLWAFLLSVILMYIILASQFENLVHPFTILLSLPLSVPFALVSLYVANQTINLYSALGMLVLFGVVKKNAILQIDHMNNLRREGVTRLAAILQANRDRLRPILMTTLTLIAGMIPLALGTGPGAEERRATAVIVIGGQSLCLLLTLLFTPVAYSILDDWGGSRFFRKHAEPVSQPAAKGATAL